MRNENFEAFQKLVNSSIIKNSIIIKQANTVAIKRAKCAAFKRALLYLLFHMTLIQRHNTRGVQHSQALNLGKRKLETH